MKRQALSRTVWLVSLISLFTDAASEMLYPIMPSFLQSIGFSVLFIGILEGLAEALAGYSKAYFGKQSDYLQKRSVFVQAGYTLSAFAKPLMAFASFPLWIFFTRLLDRLGKGIRSGARDAILTAESTQENRGRIFGFHRSMDTLGAVIGPCLALLYLYYNPGKYQTLFLLAFIPGMLAVLVSMLLKDKGTISPKSITKPSFFKSFDYWKKAPQTYKKMVRVLLLFALFNSSDLFLLMRAKELGFSDLYITASYIFYNLIYALFAFPMGIVGDKIGLKKTYVIGLFLFAITYFGINYCTNISSLIVVLCLYGLYAASTEGIAKALLAQTIPKNESGSAMGTFAGLQSIALLIASTLCGFIWFIGSAQMAFMASAFVAIACAVYLWLTPKN
jgi:MFS family permease